MMSNKFSLTAINLSNSKSVIGVYAEADNFYEAWCAAFNETMLVIGLHERGIYNGDFFTSDEIEVSIKLDNTDFNEGVFNSNALRAALYKEREFKVVSTNLYEAVAKLFNHVLDELQRGVSFPVLGRKDHCVGSDDTLFPTRGMSYSGSDWESEMKEAKPYFVFENHENLDGGDIAIPDEYIRIAPSVFEGRSDIVNVWIPDGVTSIGHLAFANCENLQSIRLPDYLLCIEHSAFAECKSLKSIAIPHEVKILAYDTFRGCENLQNVTLPNNEIEIRESSFSFCTSLKEITIPAKAVSVDAGAFTGCTSLQNIFVNPKNAVYSDINGVLYNKDQTILIRYPEGKKSVDKDSFHDELMLPYKLTEIGAHAFSGCRHLRAILISRDLTKISSRAFNVYKQRTQLNEAPKYIQQKDGIADIYVHMENKSFSSIDGVLFNKEQTVLLVYPKGKVQQTYTVPDGVTEIASGAFKYCLALKSVNLPQSLRLIRWRAFSNCDQLEQINIPEDIGTIDSSGIYNCANLKLVRKGE